MPKPLWIIATPRTGTTLIQKLLNQTGQFDPPFTEWFNPVPYFEHRPWEEDYPPKYNKVFPMHYAKRMGDHNLDPVMSHYPDMRFAVFYRHDKAAQTASWIYSCATGIWNTQNPDRIREYQSKHPQVTDRIIRDQLWRIVQEDEIVWQMLGTRPHWRFEYERVISDPVGVTNTILGFCGGEYVPEEEFDLDQATKKLEHPGKEELTERIRREAEKVKREAEMYQSGA